MVNKVILIGNVGLDPEVRALEGGTKMARVRMATTERIFDRQTNSNKEHTEWHTVIFWRGLADVVDRYVHKGSRIFVEGRLRTREWTDKDGIKRHTTEIMADNMNLLDRRSDNQQGGYQQQGGGFQQTQQGGYQQGGYAQPAQQPAPAPKPVAVPAEDPDDLPF